MTHENVNKNVKRYNTLHIFSKNRLKLKLAIKPQSGGYASNALVS